MPWPFPNRFTLIALLVVVLQLHLILCNKRNYDSKYSRANIPEWKQQACAKSQKYKANSHYICDDKGDFKCLPGWQGDLCQVPMCRRGCDPMNGYCQRPGECRCRIGYTGELCEKCIPLPGCQHGICNKPFECLCKPGWDGLFCTEPTCRSGCHSTRGYCEAPGECRCRIGWGGRNCSDCSVMPGCQYGTCNKPLECNCLPGYTGLLCQTAICSENCNKQHGYCRKPGECRCKVGWTGPNCDKCFPYPGCVNGDCERPWECNCKPGWGGMLCDEKLTYCQDNPNSCENDGTCISLTKADGNFICECKQGYLGKNCEIIDEFLLTSTIPPRITPPPLPQISFETSPKQSENTTTSITTMKPLVPENPITGTKTLTNDGKQQGNFKITTGVVQRFDHIEQETSTPTSIPPHHSTTSTTILSSSPSLALQGTSNETFNSTKENSNKNNEETEKTDSPLTGTSQELSLNKLPAIKTISKNTTRKSNTKLKGRRPITLNLKTNEAFNKVSNIRVGDKHEHHDDDEGVINVSASFNGNNDDSNDIDGSQKHTNKIPLRFPSSTPLIIPLLQEPFFSEQPQHHQLHQPHHSFQLQMQQLEEEREQEEFLQKQYLKITQQNNMKQPENINEFLNNIDISSLPPVPLDLLIQQTTTKLPNTLSQANSKEKNQLAMDSAVSNKLLEFDLKTGNTALSAPLVFERNQTALTTPLVFEDNSTTLTTSANKPSIQEDDDDDEDDDEFTDSEEDDEEDDEEYDDDDDADPEDDDDQFIPNIFENVT